MFLGGLNVDVRYIVQASAGIISNRRTFTTNDLKIAPGGAAVCKATVSNGAITNCVDEVAPAG